MWRVKGFRWAASDTLIAPEAAPSHGAHSSEVVSTFKNAEVTQRNFADAQRGAQPTRDAGKISAEWRQPEWARE
jgi:hypothetical protein